MNSRVAGRRWIVGVVGVVAVVLAVILIGRFDGPLHRPAAGATPKVGPPASAPSTSAPATPSAGQKTPTSKATKGPAPSKPAASSTAESTRAPKAAPKSTAATAAPKVTTKARPGKPPKAGTGKTVPVDPVKIKSPVPLDRSVSLGGGLRAELGKFTSLEGKAVAPGEIAGDAIRFDVVVRNTSSADVDLDGLLVVVSYGKQHSPASELRSGGQPLHGSVAAGTSGTGTYVFTVPRGQRKQLRVEISYSGEEPTVAFEGAVTG